MMSVGAVAPRLRVNRLLALGFCSVAFFFGALAMAGWIQGKPQWRSFFASGSEMKANAALCLMMLGLAMALHLEFPSKVLQRISNYLAILNGIIAGATLIEYIFGANLGIDELLFVDSSTIGTSDPGRMSPPSAASLLLGTFAVMGLRLRPRWMIRVAQCFALAMAFVPAHILTSYAYGNMNVLAFGSRRAYMSVPTALALLSMSVSVLLYAPHRGLMRTMTARSHASRVFRWLLVALVLLPPAIGWFVLTWLGGADAPPEFGVATTVMLSIVFLAALAWLNATRLNRAEEALRDSERMQRLLAQIGEVAARVPQTGRLTETIAELVAREFRVSRCGFARINLEAGELAAQYDYHGSFPPLSGVLPLSQYADHLKADGVAGRTTVIEDLSAHPGTASAYENTFKAMHVRAHINVPLSRDGKWVASFWVSHHEPRRWTAPEVETLQIIADRVWIVIQQARMEEKAAWLASFPQQNPNPIIELEAGTGVIHYVNPAAEQLFPHIAQQGLAHPFLAGVLDLGSPVEKSMRAVNRQIMVGDSAYTQTISFVRETNRLRVYSTDITDRKRTQEALRRTAEKFQLVSDTVPALISYVDLERRYQFCNRGYMDWFGVSPDRVIGSKMSDVLGEQAWQTAGPHIEAAFAGGTVEYETEAKYKTGKRWIHAIFTPHKDQDGKVLGIVVMVMDITDRKQWEHALENRERLLSVATSGARAGLVVVNSSYKYLFANEAYGEVLGLPKNDIVGRHVYEVLPDGWSQIRPRLDRAFAGERVTYELTMPGRMGGDTMPRWFDVIYEPQVGDTNDRTVVVVVADITLRKRAENALRESEERLRLFIQHAPAALAMFDRDMRYLAVSNRWEQDYGLKSEIVGRSHYDVFPEIPQRWRQTHQRALSGEVLSSEEDPFERANGSLQYIKWEIRPWRNSNNDVGGILIAAEDVTARVLARRELEEAQAQLSDRALHLEELVRERTAKLTEAVNELESWSYSIAHDMRAPLRAMHGFSALLEQNYGPELDNTGKSYLQRITASATRLDRLIQDVLNYSKVARADLQLHSVDLEALFQEIIESYPALQPPKAHISFKAPLPRVLGNTAALTQVLSNLLGNAVKFARDGVEPRVCVFAENHGDLVRLTVEDNGVGIPQESQARIFQMFQRLHPASEYEGTGIGLAIVRKAVERMGGTVGVESDPGRGSRFWVQLRRG